MTIRRVTAASLLLLLASGAASADDMVSFATGGYANQLRTPAMMHKIDTNQDGMVSKGEWDAYQQKLFAMMDADTSGALDKEEFMHSHPDAVASFATGGFANELRTTEMFAKLDTDHDGKISSAEFAAYQAKLFAMMDTAKTHMLDQTAFFGRGPAR